MTKPNDLPENSVFISYSSDPVEDATKVAAIVKKLTNAGFFCIFDQKDLHIGNYLDFFMHQGLRTGKKVLVFTNNTYVQKANQMKGGVSKETRIIADFIADNPDQTRVLFYSFGHEPNTKKPLLPDYAKGIFARDIGNLSSDDAAELIIKDLLPTREIKSVIKKSAPQIDIERQLARDLWKEVKDRLFDLHDANSVFTNEFLHQILNNSSLKFLINRMIIDKKSTTTQDWAMALKLEETDSHKSTFSFSVDNYNLALITISLCQFINAHLDSVTPQIKIDDPSVLSSWLSTTFSNPFVLRKKWLLQYSNTSSAEYTLQVFTPNQDGVDDWASDKYTVTIPVKAFAPIEVGLFRFSYDYRLLIPNMSYKGLWAVLENDFGVQMDFNGQILGDPNFKGHVVWQA
ncbi:toll/interleukin-1 receptor domain-containing protein [Furfurilactobacillus milii]|uniref:TIR domain-containing protein n=1 Tax=Furfurilactobacillus milii TaxID=2888272 RepID=A0A6N9HZD0_9LACO|nr:toll/interleukin-1 receptor domain-containing protein [Furfurilactobacillus milii]MYV16065.1 hypothetical protein [Furfurilactobacillus milii]